jgi:hypothetical protein
MGGKMADSGPAKLEAVLAELETSTSKLREAISAHAHDYLEHLEARRIAVESLSSSEIGGLDEADAARLQAVLNQGEWILEHLRGDRMQIRETLLRLNRQAQYARRLEDDLPRQTATLEASG